MSNKEDVAVDAFPSGNTEATHVLRKIDFHLAKKTYSCLLNTSDFKLETLNPSASSSSSQPLTPSSSKKAEVSEFLDSVLDADLTFRISFRRIGAGLENLGNTCFLNSVLQCLTYTEPLVGYLQSGKHQNTCHIAGFCALCAIQRHVSRALQSTGRIVAPKDLVSNLRCISRNFRNARQEDAHEYMIHLLESMHKCCLPSGVPAQSPSAYDKSLVHKIFGGRLRSQVKCLQCSYCSNTFDPFLDLSLEIAKADSLSKALVHFTAAEQLDGGERQYKCERCKHKVRALKQLTIYKAPYVLAIHLKRFRSHFGGQKIDKKVQFGSTLDLKPFVSGAYEGDLKYTLYGVLVHAGWSTHSGHYYCFVRTSSGIWYSLDDNRVVQASEKTVLEQKAYMLFYVRDRKNVVPKKALDIVHKESLITTMRNASSSCPTPKVKELPNDFTPRNPSETSPSSLSLKTFDSIIISEKDLTQKKTDTKSSEPLTQKSPKPTGVVASADCSGKVKDQVSAAKPVNLHCSSTDGGNLTSHVTNVAADTKDQDVLPRHENDCNSEKMDPPKSTAQIKSEIVIWKEETVTPKVDLDLVAMKSRPKLTNRKRSSKYSVCTQRRKLMKKIFGTGIGMHLSTKMLYGASSLKRRRCKIKKHSKCKTKKHSKKNMPHKNLPGQVDKGPVTSDRKSEALGIDERPQASGSSTETNHVGAGSSNYSPLQNGVSIAATKVFKETTVARWEGVDSPSAILESCNREITGIGYVPDEWDEEYDRGKKKKVRGPKLDFGGPNVFQEIATKKEKRRRKN